MQLPFIDTRDFRRLRLACNILEYADHFCLRESNRRLILNQTDNDPGAKALVEIVEEVQTELAPNLPLTGATAIWKERDSVDLNAAVETTSKDGGLPTSIVLAMKGSLNVQLLESVLSTFRIQANGPKSSESAVQLACQCAWLSEVLALVVLRVAKAEVGPSGTVILSPATDAMREHLRRLWFASAFDQASLAAATVAIANFAAVAADPSRRSQFRDARVAASAVFPQHWRLPVDAGPVPAMWHDWLEPLLMMIIHTVAASNYRGAPPFGPAQAAEKEITEVFNDVLELQSRLPIVDRLFDVVGGGLVLGSRDLATASIEVAEKLADRALGADWHSNVTSDAQKAYLLDRIGRCAHVEILDFELRQHHTTENVDLDVDFFIRDKIHNQIYGVQLKHLQKRARGGLLTWLAMFREREAGLGNLVRQLENLKEVARVDEKSRSVLIKRGLTPSECDRVVPVGLHNVGFVDFWTAQNGVLLYDMPTFANVLAGRTGVAVGSANGLTINQAIAPAPGPTPSPHEPASVIEAYLLDQTFSHLGGFDAAAHLVRTIRVGRSIVEASGLGI